MSKKNYVIYDKTIMCYLQLLLISFFLVSCAGSSGIDPLPEQSEEPGWHEATLEHDGLERLFRFYIPVELPSNAPVVILLHGGTQSMDAIFRPNAGGTNEWPILAEEERFLLIVPNGINVETGSPEGDNQNWNDCRTAASSPVSQSGADDVGFITELTYWAESRFGVDASRLYATGSSNGGQMAYRLAIERPDRFVAIAAFIANLPEPEDSVCKTPANQMPVLMVNGTADPLIPFEGGNTDRGNYLSAPSTRDIWADANSVDIDQRTETELPDIDPNDGSFILCEDDPDPSGTNGLIIRFCRMEGGGHVMPSINHQIPGFVEGFLGSQNSDIEGARFAWEFLSGHRK